MSVNFILMMILLAIISISTWVNTKINSFNIEHFKLMGHDMKDNSIRGVKQSILNDLPELESNGYQANMLKGNGKSMHIFANNVFTPNCCKYSGISSRDGCACLTYEQVNI